MSRSVLFDTETTGLEPLAGDRVIEVAAIELINDLPTRRSFHRLIHPGRDIPEDSTRIHGITLEHLRDAPRFEAVVDELLEFFGDAQLVAHNAPFDFGFLNAELARLKRPPLARERMVDTLVLAKARFPGMPNSLDALCRRFNIDLSERTTHNALLDCRLLAEVYVELTGGRQRGLVLADEDGQGAMPVARYDLAGPRTPRLIVPSEAELAAHAAFVAKLKDPVWTAS
ncbi:MAG TPA: DNA polymerase III subunit epsilon [Acetobacteraceae bacterium]